MLDKEGAYQYATAADLSETPGLSRENGTDPLSILIRLASEADTPGIAKDAAALAERIAEGRFYVACVGQFKRGKSTLLNALIGDPILPAGVAPVTSVVTVIRY